MNVHDDHDTEHFTDQTVPTIPIDHSPSASNYAYNSTAITSALFPDLNPDEHFSVRTPIFIWVSVNYHSYLSASRDSTSNTLALLSGLNTVYNFKVTTPILLCVSDSSVRISFSYLNLATGVGAWVVSGDSWSVQMLKMINNGSQRLHSRYSSSLMR